MNLEIKKVLSSFGIDEKTISKKNMSMLQKLCENPNDFSYEKLQEVINTFIVNQSLKPINTASIKIGRNDRCICGSGRKFKKCCYDKH